MKKELNINDQVSFELTENGAKIANKYVSKMRGDRKYIAGKKETHLLWSVMQMFGNNIYMGGPNIFKDNKLTIEK